MSLAGDLTPLEEVTVAENMNRDAKTGRFARRPVPDVDAESKFDPMGDDIPFYDASGAPSANTIDRARYAPAGDELAQGGQRSRLRARNPEMVDRADTDHTIYGRQGAVLRTAARSSLGHWDDPTGYVVGLNEPGTPANGVRQISDDVPGVPAGVRGDLLPASRGLGRGRRG
jgi:hypothetical protein